MTREEENKLIERTCKHDAYQSVWLWAKGGKPDVDKKDDPLSVAWYAKEKMENHALWLAEQEYKYEYAPSGIVKKAEVPLGFEEK